MTHAAQNAIHEECSDCRLYLLSRDGCIVKRYWHQMSGAEHAQQIEAEERAAYVAEFNIY